MSRQTDTMRLIKALATCEKVTIECDKCHISFNVGRHMWSPEDTCKCGGKMQIQEAQ